MGKTAWINNMAGVMIVFLFITLIVVGGFYVLSNHAEAQFKHSPELTLFLPERLTYDRYTVKITIWEDVVRLNITALAFDDQDRIRWISAECTLSAGDPTLIRLPTIKPVFVDWLENNAEFKEGIK